jgi:hypothetical protein
MIRPAKIYLESAILIKGIKVLHTEEGLKYLIHHYEELLQLPKRNTTQKVIEHMQWCIANWKQHVTLYEQEKETTITPEL